jgi:hypothetical protein
MSVASSTGGLAVAVRRLSEANPHFAWPSPEVRRAFAADRLIKATADDARVISDRGLRERASVRAEMRLKDVTSLLRRQPNRDSVISSNQ